jgi:hypothetical protein
VKGPNSTLWLFGVFGKQWDFASVYAILVTIDPSSRLRGLVVVCMEKCHPYVTRKRALGILELA